MIEITPTCQIPDDELAFEFLRSSGPGGQNVNKLSTAVRLRFDVINSPSLPAGMKSRLYKSAGNRISKSGILTLVARNSRRQERNRKEVLARFVELLQQAAVVPKPYKRTSVPFGSRLSRLENKKHRSIQKQLRRFSSSSEE